MGRWRRGGKGNREVEEGLRIPIPLSLLFFTFIPLSSMGLAFFLMHLQGSFCLAKKQFLAFFNVLETYQSCTRARSPTTTAQNNIALGQYQGCATAPTRRLFVGLFHSGKEKEKEEVEAYFNLPVPPSSSPLLL